MSSAFPDGLVVDAIHGPLMLAAVGISAVLYFRYRLRPRISISDSGCVSRDLEFVESTLHETVVPFSDSVTVEAVHSNGIFTFLNEDSRIQSFI
jgi:hypothetical protein